MTQQSDTYKTCEKSPSSRSETSSRRLLEVRHTTMQVPKSIQVLVIGGGPSGSYAASALAQNGLSVCLLEAGEFPRDHVGESMLPSLRPFLEYIGADEAVARFGFTVKPGAAMKFSQWKREGYSDFTHGNTALEPTWNVLRRDFDHILLRHAEDSGVHVFEATTVKEIQFDAHGLRPVAATYAQKDGKIGDIAFDYLVDASGRAGLMSQRYLQNRRFNPNMKNQAFWGYWKGADMYGRGTSRQNAPFFEVLSDGTGWVWMIPLHNGTTSVGVVVNAESSSQKRKSMSADAARGDMPTLEQHYHDQIKLAPNIAQLLQNASLLCEEHQSQGRAVQVASDYSYSASMYAGAHFRLVGDAAAFIDPFFSSGVHLGFVNALSAAASICASVKKQCTEAEAASFHDQTIKICYNRFLIVVSAAYKQMRAQDAPVLLNHRDDSFDDTFRHINPLIQGSADIGRGLNEGDLDRAINFLAGKFTPADPESKLLEHHQRFIRRKVLRAIVPEAKYVHDSDVIPEAKYLHGSDIVPEAKYVHGSDVIPEAKYLHGSDVVPEAKYVHGSDVIPEAKYVHGSDVIPEAKYLHGSDVIPEAKYLHGSDVVPEAKYVHGSDIVPEAKYVHGSDIVPEAKYVHGSDIVPEAKFRHFVIKGNPPDLSGSTYNGPSYLGENAVNGLIVNLVPAQLGLQRKTANGI